MNAAMTSTGTNNRSAAEGFLGWKPGRSVDGGAESFLGWKPGR